MLATAVGASVRPAPRMRSTLSMKPIVWYTRPLNPNSSGRPRRAARVRRLLAARRARLRFGVTTRKPVPPFAGSCGQKHSKLNPSYRLFAAAHESASDAGRLSRNDRTRSARRRSRRAARSRLTLRPSVGRERSRALFLQVSRVGGISDRGLPGLCLETFVSSPSWFQRRGD